MKSKTKNHPGRMEKVATATTATSTTATMTAAASSSSSTAADGAAAPHPEAVSVSSVTAAAAVAAVETPLVAFIRMGGGRRKERTEMERSLCCFASAEMSRRREPAEEEHGYGRCRQHGHDRMQWQSRACVRGLFRPRGTVYTDSPLGPRTHPTMLIRLKRLQSLVKSHAG